MAKRKMKPSIEAKMELWEWGLSSGLRNLHSHNCLYSEADKGGNRTRLNFRDTEVLRRQRGRRPNARERKARPNKGGFIWEDEAVAAYGDVKITDGGLIFPPPTGTKKEKPAEA